MAGSRADREHRLGRPARDPRAKGGDLMSLAQKGKQRVLAGALPAPTRRLEQGLADIREHGLAIVPDVLTGDALKRTREALYRAAEQDRARGREQKFALDYA